MKNSRGRHLHVVVEIGHSVTVLANNAPVLTPGGQRAARQIRFVPFCEQLIDPSGFAWHGSAAAIATPSGLS